MRRVLVIDGHRARAEAVGMAVEMESDLELVGSVQTTSDALAQIATGGVDVVVMDGGLGNTAEHVRRLHAEEPDVHTVVVTPGAEPTVVLEAVEAGAGAFVAGDDSLAQLLAAVRAVDAGQLLLPVPAFAAIVDLARTSGSTDGNGPAPDHRDEAVNDDEAERRRREAAHRRFGLTPRERDVLELLTCGYDPQAIARELYMSIHTSRGHLKSIMMKLGAHSQLEVVVTAARHGLVEHLAASSEPLPARG